MSNRLLAGCLTLLGLILLERLGEYGLLPLGQDSTYYQQVPLNGSAHEQVPPHDLRSGHDSRPRSLG